jgi:hypothetical protein
MKNTNSVNIGFHSTIRFPVDVLGMLMTELRGVCTVQAIIMVIDSPVPNSEYTAEIDVSGNNLASFTAVLANFPTTTVKHITLNADYAEPATPGKQYDESIFTTSENTLIKILLKGWTTVEKIHEKTGWAPSGIHARFTGLRNSGIHIEKMKNGTENSRYRIVSLEHA